MFNIYFGIFAEIHWIQHAGIRHPLNSCRAKHPRCSRYKDGRMCSTESTRRMQLPLRMGRPLFSYQGGRNTEGMIRASQAGHTGRISQEHRPDWLVWIKNGNSLVLRNTVVYQISKQNPRFSGRDVHLLHGSHSALPALSVNCGRSSFPSNKLRTSNC